MTQELSGATQFNDCMYSSTVTAELLFFPLTSHPIIISLGTDWMPYLLALVIYLVPVQQL